MSLSKKGEEAPMEPWNARDQNPFFAADAAFENGMMEVLVLCASKIYPYA